MRSGTILFLAGILIFEGLPSLLPIYVLPTLVGLALLLFIFRPLRWLALLVTGFSWAFVHAALILSAALSVDLEGQDIVVTGVVRSIPEVNAHRTRFEFEIESLVFNGQQRASPGRVRLSWYRFPPAINAGERWQLPVRLKRPHGNLNPGGMDYEAWLFQKRIRATGYVIKGQASRLSEQPQCTIECLRQRVSSTIRHGENAGSHRGLIAALAVGDRQGVSQSQWDLLRRTGTAHLMAISGLHIGLVAGLGYLLGAIAGRAAGRPVFGLTAPQLGAIFALISALAYAALSGFGLPARRALVMVMVVMGLRLYRRSATYPDLVALSLLAVLIMDPHAVLAAGFWLSFGAVALLIYAMTGRCKTSGWWWRWGRVHGIAAMGLMPLLIVFFASVPLISPFANGFAVPWVSFVVVPLTLAGSAALAINPEWGAALFEWAEQALAMLWSLLELMGQVPVVHLSPGSGSGMAIGIAVIGMILLLAPRGLPGRWLGLALLLPLVAPVVSRPDTGEVWLTLLDVGQGLSAVIHTRTHDLVFDTGPKFRSGSDAGKYTVVPYLRSQGVRRLDSLIISHGDNDHIGGADTVIRALQPARIFSSVPEKLPAWSVEHCKDGQHWRWDNVEFRILHPHETSGRGNNQSCVLQVSSEFGAVLLTGDIERQAEFSLSHRYAGQLRSDVLVAPHHGSLTSSTERLLETVRPDLVLFPAGYRNRWHFPKPAVVARYRRIGAQQLDTGTSGAISVHLTRDGLAVQSQRQSRQRYWHH